MPKERHNRNPNRGSQYLGGRYVYYKSLLTTTYYPNIAEREPLDMGMYIWNQNDSAAISNYFRNLAQHELEKELNLINEKFGSGVKGDYTDQTFAKRLIDALNKCMGIKEIYERNLALIIESSGGQKNIMSNFPTYFESVWQQWAPTIYEEAQAQFENKDQIDLSDALANAVNHYLPDIIRAALQKMFGAGVEQGIHKNRDQYKTAYAEMSEALRNNAPGTEEFVQSFIQNYKLDELVNVIRNTVQDEERFLQTVGKSGSDFNVRANVAQRAGLTMEQVRNYAINIVFQGLSEAQCGPGLEMTVGGSIATGATKQKADVMATVGIPIGEVENWINSHVFGDRAKNVQAIKDLQTKLKQFNDGFIIYVNSKNYTLNNAFKNGKVEPDGDIKIGGFSAGSAITLDRFGEIADTLEVNADQLIRTCMQIIPGAIGENWRDEVELLLVRAIATALFDDFNAIGVVPPTGAQAIHILDLNGIMTPISFYFNLLADAFAALGNFQPDQLVSVQLTSPAQVLFEDEIAPPGMSETYWGLQRNDALTHIKVAWHFLSGFKDIIKQFMQQ